MPGPTIVAICVELVCLIVVLCIAKRLGVSRGTALGIGLCCLPVAVWFISFRAVFVSDAIAFLFLLKLLITRESRSTPGLWRVVSVFGVGVVLWPLLATVVATSVLNETTSWADCSLFFLRSTFALGIFVWANDQANRVGSPNAFLAIPLVFWAIYAMIGIAQFAGVVDANSFWAAHDPEHLRGMGSGFMGMDAPQLSVWAVFGVVAALWFSGVTRRWVKWLLLCMPGVSFALSLYVASRLGMIGTCLATLMAVLVTTSRRNALGRVVALVATIALVIPLGTWYWDNLEPDRRTLITSKVALLSDVHSLSEVMDVRDPSISLFLPYVVSNPVRMMIGSGIATECLAGCDVRTYAEGEFMRLLWAGGLISVLAYIAVLYFFVKRALELRPNEARETKNRPSRMLILIVGMSVYFSMAQFNLFTSIEPNVPIYYVLWLVAGALYAGNGRPRSARAVRPRVVAVRLHQTPAGGFVA